MMLSQPGQRVIPADDEEGLLQQQFLIAHSGAALHGVVKGDRRVQPAVGELLQQGGVVQPGQGDLQLRELGPETGEDALQLVQPELSNSPTASRSRCPCILRSASARTRWKAGSASEKKFQSSSPPGVRETPRLVR